MEDILQTSIRNEESDDSVEKRVEKLMALCTRRTTIVDQMLKVHSLPSRPERETKSQHDNTEQASGNGAASASAPALQSLQRDQVLWMGTVVLSGRDVELHFSSASSSMWTDSLHSEDDSENAPPPVQDKWLREHCTRWYHLGFGLAALLVSDAAMGVVDFCNSAYELLLEVEHAASAGTLLWRAQCDRALKKEREKRGVSAARLPTSIGYSFHTAPHLPFVPAYKRTVASACHTIGVAYRRMLDPDLAIDEAAFARFLSFDAVIHATFITPILKELTALATAKAMIELRRTLTATGAGGAPCVSPQPEGSPSMTPTHHQGMLEHSLHVDPSSEHDAEGEQVNTRPIPEGTQPKP